MQARYYDPVIGRFYSNDPIGFRDVHSFNRYAYANNNPYKYTDPTGKVSLPIQITRAVVTITVTTGSVVGGIIGSVIGAAIVPTKLGDGTLPASYKVDDVSPDGFDTENSDNSNPLTGEPGDCSECNNKSGDKKQKRFYGADGYPIKDVDYDHQHGKGKKKSTSPHVHDWDRPQDGSPPTDKNRSKARPPKSNELDNT